MPDRPNAGGAFPPPGKEWMIGKTLASVRFVDEAEAALATRDDIDEREKYVLRTLVQAMKDGQAILQDFESVDDWLERLRDHYP